MSKAVLYDANKCIGCRACQIACKQWNELPSDATTNRGTYENPPRLDAHTFTKIRFNEVENNGTFHFVFIKVQCMHCEYPACAAACPVGALQKTDDGPVIYDDNKCFGCRYCMVACPFGIPNYEWDTPLPWVRKCTFCSDRQSGGLKPACVSTCPTGALKYGEREELIAEARQRIAEHPDEYVNHIYGEKEAGGTSWLYLSPVPFDKLGFPNIDYEPVTVNAERAVGAVPPVLIGVAAAMTGVYWLLQRRQKLSQKAQDEKKEGAIKQ
jgi:formate dehydrogenase iron-sulfur subunit